MLLRNKIIKHLLGVVLTVFALYIGKAFWVYFFISFQSPVNILIGLNSLGYIYIAIGIIRLKKWAIITFSIIFISSVFLDALYVITTGVNVFLDFLFHFVVWVTIFLMPIFITFFFTRKNRHTDS